MTANDAQSKYCIDKESHRLRLTVSQEVQVQLWLNQEVHMGNAIV